MSKSLIKVNLIYCLLLITLFLFFGFVNYRLFYRQAYCDQYVVNSSNVYYSDMPIYISIVQGIETEYKVTYPVFFELSRFLLFFTSPNTAVALATLILNMLCIPIMTLFFLRELKDNENCLNRIVAIFLPYITMLVSMLWLPNGNSSFGVSGRYLGVFSPNPLQNQTYLAARPFAIIAFVFFTRILNYYETQIVWRDCLIFSISLLVATMTKPSFTLVFGSAVLPVVLLRLVIKKFKTLKNTFWLGVCFLPTIVNLLIQYIGMFTNGSSEAETGIGFGFLSVWSIYSHNILLSLALALAFPIIVLIFNLSSIAKNRAYRFAWWLLLAGTLEFMFLEETGSRLAHANFAWGYMYGVFFAFFMSIWLLFKNTISKEKHVLILGVEWGVLLLHLICGIVYFVYMENGGNYFQF